MIEQLKLYCIRTNLVKVKEILASDTKIDITDENCLCIRHAIANKSTEILRALLKYYSDQEIKHGHEERKRIADDLNHLLSLITDDKDFSSGLTPEMMDIVIEYAPWLAEAAFLNSVDYFKEDTFRYLYPNFKKLKYDILEEVINSFAYEAIDSLAYKIVETIAQMEPTNNDKAILYCDIGDLFNRIGCYEKAIIYYEKAITADSDYINTYIHYANSIVERICLTQNYIEDDLLKAEEYYKKTIEKKPEYSSAFKKLGILYKELSEYKALDIKSKEQFEIKALKAYIDAIKTKSAKIKYESVYKEVESIISKYSENEEVKKITSEEVVGKRLNELFLRTKLGEKLLVKSSEDEILEILQDMALEDLEYEETSMDRDLIGDSTAELIAHANI